MRFRSGHINFVAIVFLAIGVGAAVFIHSRYQAYSKEKKREAQMREQEAWRAREKAAAERKAESERVAAEEREKQLEKQRAEQKREAARREAEAEEAEIKRQVARREALRDEYEKLRGEFRDKTARIWADASAESRPKLQSVTNTFVFQAHGEDNLLYRVEADRSGKFSVRSFSGLTPANPVRTAVFEEQCQNQPFAFVFNDDIWVKGIAPSGTSYPIPPQGDFLPVSAEFGLIGDILTEFGSVPPDIQCRLTLINVKSPRSRIDLGVVPYGETLDREKITAPVTADYLKRKGPPKKKRTATLEKPKLVKFRQTVFFYDGEMIKQKMGGQIYVPREFVFTGSGNKREAAQRRWKELCEEARQQEEKAASVAEENRRLMEEYEARLPKQKAKDDVPAFEIETELASWRIRIDRKGISTHEEH